MARCATRGCRRSVAITPAASDSQPMPCVANPCTSSVRAAHQPAQGAGSQACAMAAGSTTACRRISAIASASTDGAARRAARFAPVQRGDASLGGADMSGAL